MIEKKLSEVFAGCVYYQPSVLVVDDLHCLAGIPSSPEQETSAEATYYRK